MKLIFPGPTTCGKPEQPPNSTLISNNFDVGSRIEYICDEGHLLVGPARRNCLATGFYSEFPPVCRCKCFPSSSMQIILYRSCRLGMRDASRHFARSPPVCERHSSVQVNHPLPVQSRLCPCWQERAALWRRPALERSPTPLWTRLLWWTKADPLWRFQPLNQLNEIWDGSQLLLLKSPSQLGWTSKDHLPERRQLQCRPTLMCGGK